MLVALCDPAAAEATRRALDREGFLDVAAKAFRTASGMIALPLQRTSEGSTTAASSSLQWSGGTLETAELEPPAGRNERGQSAALRAACARAIDAHGVEQSLRDALLAQEALPKHWEKLGDVVLFAPAGMFDGKSASGAALGALSEAARVGLLAALASALGAQRIGVQGRIEESLHRKSCARLLWPAACTDGWTVQRDNGISYGLDVTRSMFSSGNGTEKARVARFPCGGETVVDLYAGIGYFTLAYLVHAGCAQLHACEWDDDALVALRHNLGANGVAARCTVYAGDNARSLPHFAGVAHRVNLGLIPSSEAGWPIAVGALRPEGGMLHVHANVGSAADDEAAWTASMLASLTALSRAIGREWRVELVHLERVKWYAPRIRHVVADVRCSCREVEAGAAAPAAQQHSSSAAQSK